MALFYTCREQLCVIAAAMVCVGLSTLSSTDLCQGPYMLLATDIMAYLFQTDGKVEELRSFPVQDGTLVTALL